MKEWARATWTRDLGKEKKKTVAAATGPVGALHKQGTVKAVANFDRTNDTIVEYVRFTLGPVASKAVRTLTRLVSTTWARPKRNYRLVAPPLVEGGLPVVMEVTIK